MELNFSLKLLCCMLSQTSQVLQNIVILKYYFHAKDKKCPTATLSGQDEANLAFLLAIQAGEIGAFCPLGISHVGPASKSSILGLILVCVFIEQEESKVN